MACGEEYLAYLIFLLLLLLDTEEWMEYLTLKIKIMEQEKVNRLLMMMGSKIPSESLHSVREKLLDSDMNESDVLVLINGMKDPTISIILSILVGVLGVDRFYIGDIGLGVGKLLTGGGCYIWALVDIFLIMDATRQKNLELLLTHLR